MGTIWYQYLSWTSNSSIKFKISRSKLNEKKTIQLYLSPFQDLPKMDQDIFIKQTADTAYNSFVWLIFSP